MTLDKLETGSSAKITTVGGEGALRQHFLDMGIIPGAEVTLVKYAPMGDPIEVLIHGYALTLRIAEAEKIGITPIKKDAEASTAVKSKKGTAHPAFGEPGIHHVKGESEPFPDSHVLTFALVGNQNSGKTTLFNQLTGANQMSEISRESRCPEKTA